MLETVLQIGKAFRASPEGLKHHRYVGQCPSDTKKETVLRLSLPVRKDFGFDWESINTITDENMIRDKLFYLKFKTADSDSLVKYIFGDIFYTLTKDKDKDKEGGYYRLGDPNTKAKGFQVSSFYRGEEDFTSIAQLYRKDMQNQGGAEAGENFLLQGFRQEFAKNLGHIERLLRYQAGIAQWLDEGGKGNQIGAALSNETELKRLAAKRTVKKSSLFLHFDFQEKHWYEFLAELAAINQKLLEDFLEEVDNPAGYALKKFAYKTLIPGRDLRFFSTQGNYRNKLFSSKKEVLDLLYALDYSQTAVGKPYKTDIKIIVLPRGNNLAAEDYEKFIATTTAKAGQESESVEQAQGEANTGTGQDQPNPQFQTTSLEKKLAVEKLMEQELAAKQELAIKEAEQKNVFEDFCDETLEILTRAAENIVQFDVIFSRRGGMSSPDVDLIELAGLQKSHLCAIYEKIQETRKQAEEKRRCQLPNLTKELKPLRIVHSFLNILGNHGKEQKKYQAHLLKVLPQIYTGTYYHDPILLPAFISKTEANIRDENANFGFLKYDFEFLTRIQNNTSESNYMDSIVKSSSYELGIALGKLARTLEREIKSFEKSYVGNLTRRIATLPDLIQFKTFMEEKLIIHEKAYPNIRETSIKLAQAIKDFSGSYNKNECAFGFFESYFAPWESKKDKEDKNNQ